MANGVNRNFTIPVKNITGKNTTMITSVEANTGVATSKAASKEACQAVLFIFRCRSMFSNTTMELSTSRPSTKARPPSVILLIACPVMDSTMNAKRIESGKLIDTISAERKFPRNKISTMITNASPPSPAYDNPEIAFLTYEL